MPYTLPSMMQGQGVVRGCCGPQHGFGHLHQGHLCLWGHTVSHRPALPRGPSHPCGLQHLMCTQLMAGGAPSPCPLSPCPSPSHPTAPALNLQSPCPATLMPCCPCPLATLKLHPPAPLSPRPHPHAPLTPCSFTQHRSPQCHGLSAQGEAQAEWGRR